jgi:hypothetical protein
LLNGWGPVTFGAASGSCSVDFAGGTDLTGAGVLCYVRFLASATATGSTALTPSLALFNEVLPAKTTSGTVTVTGLPVIAVAPDQVTLLAGGTRQFTVSGSATAPIAWSVLDPAVASISAGGLLTALAGGTTRVRAVDAIGANDLNTSVRVYDLRVALDTVSTLPGSTVYLPVVSDRLLGGFDIRSLQYAVT